MNSTATLKADSDSTVVIEVCNEGRSNVHAILKRFATRAVLDRLGPYVLPPEINRPLFDLATAIEVSAARISPRVIGSMVVDLDLLLSEITGPSPRWVRCKNVLDGLHRAVLALGNAAATLLEPIEMLRCELLG